MSNLSLKLGAIKDEILLLKQELISLKETNKSNEQILMSNIQLDIEKRYESIIQKIKEMNTVISEEIIKSELFLDELIKGIESELALIKGKQK